MDRKCEPRKSSDIRIFQGLPGEKGGQVKPPINGGRVSHKKKKGGGKDYQNGGRHT